MYPKIGPIHLYDLFTVAGLLLAGWYMTRVFASDRAIPRGKILAVIVGGAFASLYGGAILPWAWRLIRSNPAPHFLASGRYFHSAFLAVLAYLPLAMRWLRFPLAKALDHYAIAALVMSAIGRLGCFSDGCCAGKPTQLPWGVAFPNNPLTTVHPTQLYMAGSEALLVWLLLRIHRKRPPDGQTFWTAVWLYSVYRIGMEALRTNPVFVWNLTHAQAFSLLTLALSSVVLIRRRGG